MKERRPRMKRLLVRLVIVAAVIASCGIGIGLTSILSPTPATEPLPLILKEPSAAATPYPTLVPLPTYTPYPTQEPLPTPSLATDYPEQVALIMNQLASDMNALTALCARVSDDSSLLLDAAWKQSVVDLKDSIRRSHLELEGLVPPYAFERSHDYLLEAAGWYDTSMDTFVRGIEQIDADIILLSVDQVNKGTDLLNKAREALP